MQPFASSQLPRNRVWKCHFWGKKTGLAKFQKILLDKYFRILRRKGAPECKIRRFIRNRGFRTSFRNGLREKCELSLLSSRTQRAWTNCNLKKMMPLGSQRFWPPWGTPMPIPYCGKSEKSAFPEKPDFYKPVFRFFGKTKFFSPFLPKIGLLDPKLVQLDTNFIKIG